MKKIFLPLVMMLCTLGSAFGQTEIKPSQSTQNETKNDSGKRDCSSKDASASQQDNEGDPEAPQNSVEYGGGG